MSRRILATLATLLALASARAQDAGGDADGPAVRDRELGQELQKTVDAYELKRLKEVLGLSDDAAARITPMIVELTKARREFQRARMERARQLFEKSHDPSTTDADLERGLNELRQMERDFLDKQRSREDALLRTLEPRQRIQFLAFRERFPKELRHKLDELREQNGLSSDRPRRRLKDRRAGAPDADDGSSPAAPSTPPPQR